MNLHKLKQSETAILNIEEQIKNRVYDYDGDDVFINASELAKHLIYYFSYKATKAKRFYKIFRFSSVVSISIVTILSFLKLSYGWNFLDGVILSTSIIATILTTLLSITNTQKDWIYNRSISQKLQSERFYYKQGVEKYNNIEPKKKVKIFSEELIKIWNKGHEEWETIKLEK